MDVIKDIYEFELRRRDEVTNRLSVAVTVITILGTVLGYFVSHFKFSYNPRSILMGLVLLVDFILLSLAVFNFFLALIGRVYQVLPPALEIIKWKLKVQQHFGAKSKKRAQEFIDDGIRQRMAQAADHNSKINQWRSAYLNRSYFRLAFSAAISIIYSTSFVLGYK